MKELVILLILVYLGMLSAPVAVLGGPEGKEVQIGFNFHGYLVPQASPSLSR